MFDAFMFSCCVSPTANAEDISGLAVFDAKVPEIIDTTMPTKMNTG